MGCFSAHINSTTIVGGGEDGIVKEVNGEEVWSEARKEVFLFDSGSFEEIKSLNIPRSNSSSIILSRKSKKNSTVVINRNG